MIKNIRTVEYKCMNSSRLEFDQFTDCCGDIAIFSYEDGKVLCSRHATYPSKWKTHDVVLKNGEHYNKFLRNDKDRKLEESLIKVEYPDD